MSQFEELLRENKLLINKALLLDNEYWGLNKNFKDIFNGKNNLELDSNKTYIVLYQGEIEFTKLICDTAIKSGANVIFSLNDEYLATNELIVRIANQIIGQENLSNIIKLYNNIQEEKLFKGMQTVDEVVFIGSSFDYREVKNKIKCPCKLIKVEENE